MLKGTFAVCRRVHWNTLVYCCASTNEAHRIDGVVRVLLRCLAILGTIVLCTGIVKRVLVRHGPTSPWLSWRCRAHDIQVLSSRERRASYCHGVRPREVLVSRRRTLAAAMTPYLLCIRKFHPHFGQLITVVGRPKCLEGARAWVVSTASSASGRSQNDSLTACTVCIVRGVPWYDTMLIVDVCLTEGES